MQLGRGMTTMKIVGEMVVLPALYSRRFVEGDPRGLITRFVGRRKMPAVIKKTAATPGITTRLSWFREGCQT